MRVTNTEIEWPSCVNRRCTPHVNTDMRLEANCTGSNLTQMTETQGIRRHFGFSRAIRFFVTESFFLICAHLTLVRTSGPGDKSHQKYFLGDFCRCSLSEKKSEKKPWHSILLHRSSNAKIPQKFLRCS
jgi:hypothetical protein